MAAQLGWAVESNGVAAQIDMAGQRGVDLAEAARQLEQAAHEARVAFDCLGLDEIDRAHTHAIMARAAADAAENTLRVALGGTRVPAGL
jgi:hypothetical protein